MASSTQDLERRIRKANRKAKHWRRLVFVLGVAVVLTTVALLVLPGLAKDQEPTCGITEHTHTEECYTNEQTLICPFEENHVHTDACYEEKEVYICGFDETEGHIHTEDCYAAEQELVCEIEETEGHTHTEECYTEGELTCEIPECEPHHHSEECYKKKLICGKEECEPHTHTEDCKEIQRVLICNQVENHVHTEECYTTESKFTCELPEHTHTEECFLPHYDFEESEEDWNASVANAELTDDWPLNVAAVANTQLGYQAVETGLTNEESGEPLIYTRYGAFLRQPYGDWSAAFAAFCVKYADVPETSMPTFADAAQWLNKLNETELYHAKGTEYEVKVGDLAFFEDGLMGIVTEVTEDVFAAIEGGNGSTVARFEYTFAEEKLLGFGEMPQNPVILDAIVHTLTFEGADYTITVSYKNDAKLPEDVTLTASEYLPGTEDYDRLYQQAQEALESGKDAEEPADTIETARFFNITLWSNGVEVEPAAPVTVKVTYSDAVETAEGSDLTVVHFTEDGTELIEPQVIADEDGISGLEYTQGGFSDTGFITTLPSVPMLGATPGGTASTELEFARKKQIDYLGDNPGNTLGDKMYRLYLDISGSANQGIDLLLVLDVSSSMDRNGGASQINTFLKTYVSNFLNSNSNNRIAIISFAGAGRGSAASGYKNHAKVELDWSNTYTHKDLTTTQGTNYSAGLFLADDIFDSASISGDGNKRVMFFLSDGEPTKSFDSKTDTTQTPEGSSYDYNSAKGETQTAINYFRTNNTDVAIYTAAYGTLSQDDMLDLLDDGDDNNQSYFSTSTSDDLVKVLDMMTHPFTVTITDELSKYVSYDASTADLKIVMSNGTDTKTLWENNAAKQTFTYKSGSTTTTPNIISSVTYTPAAAGATDTTGTITATFNENYTLKDKYVYTMSYNVKLTDATKTETYNATGSENSDYPGNSTSSEKAGFYSNKQAYVGYKLQETKTSAPSYTKYYDHPVVQLKPDNSTQSDNSIVVEKKFTGITADQIPTNFAITVTSTTDATKTKTLNSSVTHTTDTSTANTIIWRWTIENWGKDTYTVTEVNTDITNMTLTDTYLPAKTTGTNNIVVGNKTVSLTYTDVKSNSPVSIADGTVYAFAATTGTSIVSEKPLSAGMRGLIEATLTAKDGTNFKNFSYYLAQDKLVVEWENVTYSKTASPHTLTFTAADWIKVAKLEYTYATEQASPEIQITNAYVPAKVKLTVDCICTQDTTKEFTYTVKYTKGTESKTFTTFKLKNGENSDDLSTEELLIPVGATYTVTETDHDGYTVLIKSGTFSQEGDLFAPTDPIVADTSVTFTNTKGDLLPATGGVGKLLLMMLGAVFLIPVTFLLLFKKKTNEPDMR